MSVIIHHSDDFKNGFCHRKSTFYHNKNQRCQWKKNIYEFTEQNCSCKVYYYD